MMMMNSLHDSDKDDDYDYVMKPVGCLNMLPMMPVTLLIVTTLLVW